MPTTKISALNNCEISNIIMPSYPTEGMQVITMQIIKIILQKAKTCCSAQNKKTA